MSITTKVTITPLEPYTLGNEQGSTFDKALATGKESYLISSNLVPEQTTIMGSLRYCLLKAAGVLKTDFNYSPAEREKINSLVGPESFSFEKSNQNFGEIIGISPIYLTGKEGEIMIPAPFNNFNPEKYEPIEFMEGKFSTDAGKISIPKSYDAKKGYVSGYVCIDAAHPGTIHSVDELFTKSVFVGNRTDKADNTEAFFKREAVIAKEGISFCVELETVTDCLPKENTVVYMGRKQSAFLFSFERMTEADKGVVELAKKFLEKVPYRMNYALSDVYVKEDISFKDFAIIQEKKIRNLETRLEADGYVGKRRKSNKQFSLIMAGSFFLGDITFEYDINNCKTIGYNHIISGGK